MDLRLRPLSHIDPLSVHLPHGTEVVTRVARVQGDRTVPQGAVGRVVGADGDLVDVHLVGVGTLRFERHELTPRKVGQVRYAKRRAEAWDALRPTVVIETTVGSHAWGLADESSDVDTRGVFALPFSWTTGLVQPPVDLVSTDGSHTFWEVGKAIRQALRADPNTLEMLFVKSVKASDPVGEWLLELRDAFVSREIYGSFGRYALSQLKRLAQSSRLAEHRSVVLEWLRADPTMVLDDVAGKLAQVDLRASATEADRVHQAKEYIKQLYRSMHDQGLLPASDFVSLVQFAKDGSTDFELPRDLRPKNAYNLLRLIRTATDWLRSGEPHFEATGEFRGRLLAVKRGEVALSEIVREAEAMTPELEDARQATTLPERPDVARADRVLKRIREELAGRFASRAAGPFGVDAAPAPEVVWDDE